MMTAALQPRNWTMTSPALAADGTSAIKPCVPKQILGSFDCSESRVPVS